MGGPEPSHCRCCTACKLAFAIIYVSTDNTTYE